MEKAEELHRALSEELHKLEMLVEHTGWARLMEIADGQVANRMKVATAPLENLLMVGLKEREQGRIDGIQFFQEMPHKRIKDIRQQLDELNEEIEDDDEPETPTAGGTSDGGDFERPSP